MVGVIINQRKNQGLAKIPCRFEEEIKNRIGKRNQDYKDPQLEGQISKLKTMTDIFEIFKESKALSETNKIIREEFSSFKAKLSEENHNILEIYKQLIESPLFEAMTSALKASIRQLGRSNQVFNTLHSLMSSSKVVAIKPELFTEEIRFAHEVSLATLKGVDKELVDTIRAIEDTDDTVGRWPQNDTAITHVKDLVAVERKYLLIDRFNSTFFDSPKDDVRDLAKQHLSKIKNKIKDLVAVWDEKAIKEVVKMKSRKTKVFLTSILMLKFSQLTFQKTLLS